jgi:hypothetical protein
MEGLTTIDLQARALAKLIRTCSKDSLWGALKGPYTACDRIVEDPDEDSMYENLDALSVSKERRAAIKSGADLHLLEHAILWEVVAGSEFGSERPVWVWDGEDPDDEDWPTNEWGEPWPSRSECDPSWHVCETQLSKVKNLRQILETKDPALKSILKDPECPHKAQLAAPRCTQKTLQERLETDVDLPTLIATQPHLSVAEQLMLAKKGLHAVNLALLEREDIHAQAVSEMWRSGGPEIQQVIFDSDQGWEPFFEGDHIQQPDRSKINQHLRKTKG